MFLHMYFLQYIMEDEPTKGLAHNNPEEAANYVKAVNLLLQFFVTDICGFDRYKHLEAWETFLHALSQLLSNWTAHISSTWTHKLYSTQYQTKPVTLSLHALKKQQTECSNVFPVTIYQQALKLHPKCAYKKTSNVLITRDNELSPDYLATFKMPTTTWQK